MAEVVENSLRFLTPGDVSAIATYVASVPAAKTDNLSVVRNEPAPRDHKEGVTAAVDSRGN